MKAFKKKIEALERKAAIRENRGKPHTHPDVFRQKLGEAGIRGLLEEIAARAEIVTKMRNDD